jgi:hypothetical protein
MRRGEEGRGRGIYDAFKWYTLINKIKLKFENKSVEARLTPIDKDLQKVFIVLYFQCSIRNLRLGFLCRVTQPGQ